MSHVKVDVWLSVAPDPMAYDALAHVPRHRMLALDGMLKNNLVLPNASTPDQCGGWTKNRPIALDPLTGEASSQLVYELVQGCVDRYTAERKNHSLVPEGDWSKQGEKLILQAATSRGGKLGQYYYKDDIMRWCRYRMPLVFVSSGMPWKLSERIDKVDLTATIDVSLAVEMA
jgi:hypothetical protein